MAAIQRHELSASLQRFAEGVRLLLFSGPDESGSRQLLAEAQAALADPADPMAVVDVAADELKGDPGRLADEAASLPMFGGRRLVRVLGAGETAREAVDLLLTAPAAGNPVLMLAGDLARSSALRKLAETSDKALLLMSWPLEGRALLRWLADEARRRHLRLAAGVGEALMAVATDQGILARELDKFALYLDSAPGHVAVLDHETVLALAAGAAEENAAALISALVAGRMEAVEEQLRLLEAASAIPVLRALGRRLLQLLEARQNVDRGMEARAAVRALRPPVYPFREQDALAAALANWPLSRLRAGLAAVLAGERAVKQAGGPGDIAAWGALLTLGVPGRRG